MLAHTYPHSEVVLLDEFLESNRPPFGLLFRVLGCHAALRRWSPKTSS
jgi:hypothetical protein